MMAVAVVSLLATEELEVAPVLAVCDSAAAVLVAVEAAAGADSES